MMFEYNATESYKSKPKFYNASFYKITTFVKYTLF